MTHAPRHPFVAACAAALSCVSPAAWPQATQPATPAATSPAFEGDERGTQLLDDALAFLEAQDALGVRIAFDVRQSVMGQDMHQAHTSDIALSGDNRFAARSVSREDDADHGMPNSTLVSDGDQLTVYIAEFNRYTTQDAPEKLTELDMGMIQVLGPAGMFIPLFAEPAVAREALANGGVKAKHVGTAEHDGQTVEHLRVLVPQGKLAFMGETELTNGLELDLMVAQGDEPWVLVVRPDMQAQIEAEIKAGRVPEQFREMKVNVSFVMTGWTTQPEAEAFVFDAPEGAEEVEDLFAMDPGQDDANDLRGEPGPAFQLASLEEGQSVSLADLEGQIVVLDFWATWCGPCVRGLPKVSGVVAEFADQGALFVAVNQREDADTIRDFLQRQDLEHLTVALDTDGDVGDAYGVGGIPHTVILDRDGVVRFVHVGFGPGSEDRVRDDIEAILAEETDLTN